MSLIITKLSGKRNPISNTCTKPNLISNTQKIMMNDTQNQACESKCPDHNFLFYLRLR